MSGFRSSRVLAPAALAPVLVCDQADAPAGEEGVVVVGQHVDVGFDRGLRGRDGEQEGAQPNDPIFLLRSRYRF